MSNQRSNDPSMAITSVTCQLFNAPLAEVLSDAKHGDHTHFDLVTVTICLADGSDRTGYTYTGGKGGRAIGDGREPAYDP